MQSIVVGIYIWMLHWLTHLALFIRCRLFLWVRTTLLHHTIVYRQEIRLDHKQAAVGCSFKHLESLKPFHRSTSGVLCLRSALLSQLEQLSRHLFHQRNTDRLRCTLQVLSALCRFLARNMLCERMHREVVLQGIYILNIAAPYIYSKPISL